MMVKKKHKKDFGIYQYYKFRSAAALLLILYIKKHIYNL